MTPKKTQKAGGRPTTVTFPLSHIEGGALVDERVTLTISDSNASQWHEGSEIHVCPACGAQAIESPLGPELDCKDGHTFYFASAPRTSHQGCCICEETGAHPGPHGYMAEGEFVEFE